MKGFLRKNALVILIVALCFVSRLPQLLSDKQVADLDECTIGLMAKHQFEGQDVALFFWGQNYGFTLIETTAISLSYAIGGVSDDAMHLALLALWAIGIVFFYKTLRQTSEPESYTPLLLCLVFVFSPAWATGAMKMYISTFLCGAITMYLLFHRTLKEKTATYIALGILLSLIYETQPLWLAGLTPFLLYRFYVNRSFKKAAVLSLTVSVCIAVFLYLKQGLLNIHIPYIFDGDANIFQNILRIHKYLHSQLHGMYFFLDVQKPDKFTSAFAYLVEGITYFLIISAVYYLVTKKKDAALFIVSVVSIILTLSYTVILTDVAPRYLMPITGWILFSLHLFIGMQRKKQIFHAILFVLIGIGAVSLYHFKDFSFCKTRKKELAVAIKTLEDKHIKYVYCTDWMLEWQLSFYSKEKVIARHYIIPDRYPAYTKGVDKAFYSHQPIAVIGYDWEYCGLEFPVNPDHINGYYISYDPAEKLLLRNFALWPRDSLFHQ